jgi:translocation and assembly module TamA
MPVVAAVLLLFCTGCSLLPNRTPEEQTSTPRVLELEVLAPAPLDALLRRELDLSRVNRLAAGQPLPPGELERLVSAAPAQVYRLLEGQGYFGAHVQVAPLQGQPPRVRVTVQPGPRTTVHSLDLAVQGPLAAAAAGGDAAAREAQRALHAEWPLSPGEPFTGDAWNRAKTGALAGLRAQGYVDAQWATSKVLVDAAAAQARLALDAASGPLYRTGALRIEGLQDQDEQTVRNIADLEPGTPATETLLLDFQERLQRSGLFDRATVTLEPDAVRPEATPVRVRLGERQLQEATVGLGVSADEGARATLEHVHRRPFDRPWLARNQFTTSQVRQRWEGELSTQTLPGLFRNLLAGSYERLTSDTDTVLSGSVRLGRARETRQTSRLLFVEAARSVTRSGLGRSRSESLALHHHRIWRSLDDMLLPTRGHAVNTQIGAGVARSAPGSTGPFGRAYARLDIFRPLGRTWHAEARAELGQVWARDEVVVPEDLRFRAGGEHSVRGYAYRSLTPVVNGIEVGGRVLFTASVEVARPLLERLPQLWGAVFVDAGNAADEWHNLDPALGYGAGLRYRSPVGPVKLDLAWGREVHKLRLHLSVGVVF